MRRLLKLDENRVRRNYSGGYNLDKIKSGKSLRHDMPEEWIASLVEARNPGLDMIDGEGLSAIDGKTLYQIIREDPVFYLGEKHYREKGIDLGFLAKILDSSMRLHVQVHPTAEFARKYLDSEYGKLECYYILDTASESGGYIRLGFQKCPERDEWKRIIEEQDIKAMDSCFEKVPVHKGEVWYIPGGVPHAIGPDILMIEIMEPSDLVVRCEFCREGIVVPPQARFMGKDLDFCLDIFRFNEESVDAVTSEYRLERKLISKCDTGSLELLVSSDISRSFRVMLAEADGVLDLGKGNSRVLINTEGNAELFYDESDSVRLGLLESAFSSYADEHLYLKGKCRIIIVESI